jgi:uncharacterized protein YprB with RNaseH-like and TPR domain
MDPEHCILVNFFRDIDSRIHSSFYGSIFSSYFFNVYAKMPKILSYTHLQLYRTLGTLCKKKDVNLSFWQCCGSGKFFPIPVPTFLHP